MVLIPIGLVPDNGFPVTQALSIAQTRHGSEGHRVLA